METETKQYEIIASLRLTEQQVNQALAQYVLNNEELKELIGSKKVMILPKWQTTKWSDKDSLVFLDFVEVLEQEETSEEISAEDAPAAENEEKD